MKINLLGIEAKPVLMIPGIVCTISIIQTSPFIVCCHTFSLLLECTPFSLNGARCSLSGDIHLQSPYSSYYIIVYCTYARNSYYLFTNVDALAESFRKNFGDDRTIGKCGIGIHARVDECSLLYFDVVPNTFMFTTCKYLRLSI